MEGIMGKKKKKRGLETLVFPKGGVTKDALRCIVINILFLPITLNANHFSTKSFPMIRNLSLTFFVADHSVRVPADGTDSISKVAFNSK